MKFLRYVFVRLFKKIWQSASLVSHCYSSRCNVISRVTLVAYYRARLPNASARITRSSNQRNFRRRKRKRRGWTRRTVFKKPSSRLALSARYFDSFRSPTARLQIFDRPRASIQPIPLTSAHILNVSRIAICTLPACRRESPPSPAAPLDPGPVGSPRRRIDLSDYAS